MRRFVASIFVCFVTCTVANAQFGTLTYNFFGAAGNVQNINSGSISAISGVTNVTSTLTTVTTANMFNTKQWTNTGTINTGNYDSLSFNTTQAISIPTISVNALSSSVGPTKVELRSSFDGFAAPLDAVKTITPGTTSALTFTLPTATFGSIAASTAIEFRIYGYASTNNGTNSEFGFISTSGTNNGISIPIFAPVPEPTSMIALSCVGLSALGFRFRRKKAVAVAQ